MMNGRIGACRCQVLPTTPTAEMDVGNRRNDQQSQSIKRSIENKDNEVRRIIRGMEKNKHVKCIYWRTTQVKERDRSCLNYY